MPRKKGKPTADDKVWEQIRTLYIFGRLDVETKEQVYPSQVELARQFDLPSSTIASRATKDKWLEARNTAKEQVRDETRQRVADGVINSLAALNEMHLTIVNGQIEAYVEKLLAGSVDVSTSEVIKAMAYQRKIYEDMFGVPQDKPVGVEVKVGVGVQVGFSDLSDTEQEVIYDVVAASQVREKRSAEIDVGNATPGELIPPLDS